MCLSPKLIVSPVWRRMAPYSTALYIDDKLIPHAPNLTNFNILFNLSEYCRNLSLNSDGSCSDVSSIDKVINSCYGVIDNLRVPVFFAAPCNKCLECSYLKRSQLVKRALFEASDYPSMFFFTLTYDNSHLHDFGLCRRDCVLSFKQFRIQLERFLNIPYVIQDRPPISVRIWYAGEYATDKRFTCRPHYHGLFFFSRHLTMKEQFRLREIFFHMKSLFSSNNVSNFWPNGFRRDLQICRSPFACARYISKYLTKQKLCDIPSCKNPPFTQGPSRNGGFGCSHIERYVDSILKSPDFTITLTDKVGNRPVKTSAPSYMLRKLFGTDLSRLLPGFALAYKYVEFARFTLLSRVELGGFGGSAPRGNFDCGPSDERTSDFRRAGVHPIAVSEQSSVPSRFSDFLEDFKHCSSTFGRSSFWSWVKFLKNFISRRDSQQLIDDCDFILNYFDFVGFPDFNEYFERLRFKSEQLSKLFCSSDIHISNSNKQFNHVLSCHGSIFDERLFANS